jgi:prohibitin 2
MKKLFLIITLLLSIASCGEIIDSGHRGVEVKFGKVSDKSLPEGFYFYNPLTTSIMEVDARVKRVEIATETYTKDVQQATLKFVINVSLDPANVHIVYRDIGVRSDGAASEDLQTKIINPVVVSEVKSVVGSWEATDLISNRQKATDTILERIKHKLAKNNIIVNNFELVDIAYKEEFENAVESKVVAIQKAEEAKNNTVKIKEEAQQRIISAKAEAESMRIRANALTANKNLIEYEQVQVQRNAIDKWNGVLPAQMLGGAVPFININK